MDRVGAGLNGLNMIAGGFKGQRELHKLGLISKKRVSLEERERAIDEPELVHFLKAHKNNLS